jgi:hypothetical protein
MEAVGFHDVPQNSFPQISTIGLGRRVVSSDNRDPRPPAKITTFIIESFGLSSDK